MQKILNPVTEERRFRPPIPPELLAANGEPPEKSIDYWYGRRDGLIMLRVLLRELRGTAWQGTVEMQKQKYDPLMRPIDGIINPEHVDAVRQTTNEQIVLTEQKIKELRNRC